MKKILILVTFLGILSSALSQEVDSLAIAKSYFENTENFPGSEKTPITRIMSLILNKKDTLMSPFEKSVTVKNFDFLFTPVWTYTTSYHQVYFDTNWKKKEFIEVYDKFTGFSFIFIYLIIILGSILISLYDSYLLIKRMKDPIYSENSKNSFVKNYCDTENSPWYQKGQLTNIICFQLFFMALLFFDPVQSTSLDFVFILNLTYYSIVWFIIALFIRYNIAKLVLNYVKKKYNIHNYYLV